VIRRPRRFTPPNHDRCRRRRVWPVAGTSVPATLPPLDNGPLRPPRPRPAARGSARDRRRRCRSRTAAGGSHHHAPCRFDTRSSPLNVSLNNPWGRVTRCGGYAILRPARCEAPAAPGQHPSQERSPRRRARLRLSSRPRGPHRQGRVRGSLRSWDGEAQSRRSHQWWVPARRPAPRARCAASRRAGRRAAGASPSIATSRRSPPAACRPGPAPQARRATARPRLRPDRGGARC